MDAPGPWGTGPFILTRGYSSITNVEAKWKLEPYTSTWLQVSEERTPQVLLKANRNYWNPRRGPRLEQVVFRNDLTPKEALDLCTTTEGQVDLVTEVSPDDAQQVLNSNYAKLVVDYGNKIVTGIFNRYKKDVDFNNRNLRLALNLSLDREAIIQAGFNGYADVVPGLTPPWAFDFPEELQPLPYDPAGARRLLRRAGWPRGRTLRIATSEGFRKLAHLMATHVERALQIGVDVVIIPQEQELKWLRVTAEKRLIPNWDILLTSITTLFYEATPAFFHRELFGADGALRQGPELPEFEVLFKNMAAQTDRQSLLAAAKDVDRYVYREALGLFLGSPRSLYAVNNHVNFRPYRTTFELADTSVSDEHWSRLI